MNAEEYEITPKRLDDLKAELASAEAELAVVKAERDKVMFEADDLANGIASAFGWDMHGESFVDAIKRVIAENETNRMIIVKLEAALGPFAKSAEDGCYHNHPGDFRRAAEVLAKGE